MPEISIPLPQTLASMAKQRAIGELRSIAYCQLTDDRDEYCKWAKRLEHICELIEEL